MPSGYIYYCKHFVGSDKPYLIRVESITKGEPYYKKPYHCPECGCVMGVIEVNEHLVDRESK